MRRVSLQTPEQFRSLAARVLAVRKPSPEEPSLDIVREEPATCEVLDDDVLDEVTGDELELAREVRIFRARVIEAVECAVETLVSDIAADVLGRELLLQPVDIEAIVDRALQRFAADEPLRVRVHPDEAARVDCGLPVIPDERLRLGDVTIELRNGRVDATFGMRLASILRPALI